MTYARKTADKYEILSYTGEQYGWEVVCVESSFKDARENIKLYRASQPEYRYRIRKRQVKIADNDV